MATTMNSFLNSFNNKFEAPVRQHLKNVYGCLALSTVSAGVGASIHLFTDLLAAGFLTSIGAIALFFLLIGTPDNGKNTNLRLAYLLGFAGLSGLGMGPLLETVIMINPSIIVTALIGTSVVFVSFTLCAMFAEQGRWLYLGGTLMTIMSSMMIMGLANLFIGSTLVYQVHLYLGLAVMCGFVLYDTQIIIEKRRMGNKDFITHAMDLFVDMIGIFRRLVIILTQKEEDQRKRRN
ncbi:Bax Inhibitor-1 [Carabus blaptoides fortunei]